MVWAVHVYRRLCDVDAMAVKDGNHGLSRFVFALGDEASMRSIYESFHGDLQVLAVELVGDGNVIERFDRLVDLLTSRQLNPEAVRAAVVAPDL